MQRNVLGGGTTHPLEPTQLGDEHIRVELSAFQIVLDREPSQPRQNRQHGIRCSGPRLRQSIAELVNARARELRSPNQSLGLQCLDDTLRLHAIRIKG